MVFINDSGIIYSIFDQFNQVTGSWFLTLLIVVILIMVVFAVLGLGVEWSVIFIMPLMLSLMAYDATFYPAGGAMLLYLAFLLAKNIFFAH